MGRKAKSGKALEDAGRKSRKQADPILEQDEGVTGVIKKRLRPKQSKNSHTKKEKKNDEDIKHKVDSEDKEEVENSLSENDDAGESEAEEVEDQSEKPVVNNGKGAPGKANKAVKRAAQDDEATAVPKKKGRKRVTKAKVVEKPSSNKKEKKVNEKKADRLSNSQKKRLLKKLRKEKRSKQGPVTLQWKKQN